MAEFTDQMTAFYERLEASQRRVLWAAVVAALLVIGGVGYWASLTPYAKLTTVQSADEAASVTRSLSRAGIPFEVSVDGRTISVPVGMEIDARRAASSEDGIVGLEGLSQIDPWVSPFQEQLHRQRMLQGELQRTINSITGVAASSVSLNLPERAAFLRDEARSTAAVTVQPDAGGSVSRDTARSIAQLVSHAVAGMTADDVTVVDASTGRLLWAGVASDPENPQNGDLTAQAARKEAVLADGVRTALARLLGSPNAAAVTVNVELETSAVQSTTSEIDPESAAPQKERIETEANGTSTSGAAGVPGTDSNLPERGGSASGSASGRKRDAQETTYQYSQTQTTTVRPAGDVRRLSASVMIDTAALKAVLGADAKPEDEVKLKQELENAVRASLGASSKRADEVVVTFVAFAPAQLDAEVPEVSTAEVVERYFPYALAVAAIGLAFLFVIRPLMASIRPPAPVSAAGGLVGAGEGADAAGDEAAGEDDLPANSPIAAGADEDDLSQRIRSHVERFRSLQPQHVSDLVRRESENSAEVLRRWIRSQGGAS